MRKKNIKHYFDTVFWYSLYFLPVLAFLIYLLSGAEFMSFDTFFTGLGFGFATDNLVLNGFAEIFGVGGILPFFSSNTPLIIFTWFICVYLCHLFTDFLLFIARLSHKWLNDLTQGD